MSNKHLWMWPNFTKSELSCKGSGEYYHDPEFLTRLELLRILNGNKPLVINSAHRSRLHNIRVGGAPFSQHKKMAVDISLKGHDPVKLYKAARSAGFLGLGLAGTFIHLDLRREIEGFQPKRKLTHWYYSKQGEKKWKDYLERGQLALF